MKYLTGWIIQLQVYNIWININPKRCSKFDPDLGAIMSGAYYVQAEQGNGNIKFERPDDARYYSFTSLNRRKYLQFILTHRFVNMQV